MKRCFTKTYSCDKYMSFDKVLKNIFNNVYLMLFTFHRIIQSSQHYCDVGKLDEMLLSHFIDGEIQIKNDQASCFIYHMANWHLYWNKEEYAFLILLLVWYSLLETMFRIFYFLRK